VQSLLDLPAASGRRGQGPGLSGYVLDWSLSRDRECGSHPLEAVDQGVDRLAQAETGTVGQVGFVLPQELDVLRDRVWLAMDWSMSESLQLGCESVRNVVNLNDLDWLADD
jgi:hypothetical protein